MPLEHDMGLGRLGGAADVEASVADIAPVVCERRIVRRPHDETFTRLEDHLAVHDAQILSLEQPHQIGFQFMRPSALGLDALSPRYAALAELAALKPDTTALTIRAQLDVPSRAPFLMAAGLGGFLLAALLMGFLGVFFWVLAMGSLLFWDFAVAPTLAAREIADAVSAASHAGRTVTDYDMLDKAEGPTPLGPSRKEIAERMRHLDEMRDAGAISAEEFEAKKAELLFRS